MFNNDGRNIDPRNLNYVFDYIFYTSGEDSFLRERPEQFLSQSGNDSVAYNNVNHSGQENNCPILYPCHLCQRCPCKRQNVPTNGYSDNFSAAFSPTFPPNEITATRFGRETGNTNNEHSQLWERSTVIPNSNGIMPTLSEINPFSPGKYSSYYYLDNFFLATLDRPITPQEFFNFFYRRVSPLKYQDIYDAFFNQPNTSSEQSPDYMSDISSNGSEWPTYARHCPRGPNRYHY